MSLPVYIVTGLRSAAMDIATMRLELELHNTVTVRHALDPSTGVVSRVVSDATGIIYDEQVQLDHPCLECTLRLEVLPTLEFLATLGRWGNVVCVLPPTAPSRSLCRTLQCHDPEADLQVAGVIAALDGDYVLSDLTRSEDCAELGMAGQADDQRGIAEVAAELVEYADVIALDGPTSPVALDFMHSLVRPRTVIATQWDEPLARHLARGVHDHPASERWVDYVRTCPIHRVNSGAVWTLDLRSSRPFHPHRLYENIEQLGTGGFRGRGSFWVPTRPHTVCLWDGAGGQLSIGTHGLWGDRQRQTRIVVTGVQAGPATPAMVRTAFDDALLTRAEQAQIGVFDRWQEDGLEPWLGDLTRSMAQRGPG